MILQLALFLLLLIVLFLLSQKIQTSVFDNLFIVTKNKKLAIGVLLILLLPGTIIHELSHFLVATMLRVPTGELTVIPSIEDGEVKAGKLFLGDTDPFRLSVIGLAPIIIGLVLIYIIGKIFLHGFPQLPITDYQLFISIYLLITISLTMFSSKKDLQGLLIAGPIILLIIISLYLVGVRVFLENNLLQKIEAILKYLNYYLLITAVLNYLVFLVLTINLSLCQKILNRRIG